MVSIREKKKLRNQQRILEVAMDFFNRQGFRQTTIHQIAQEAEVGTGTVYNYFPSKEHILAAFIQERTTRNIESYQLHDKPDNPLDDIILLFEFFFKSISFDKKLQREGFFAIFLPPTNGPSSPEKHIASQVDELDFQVISLISTILKKGKEEGKLKKDFSEDIAATTIYSVFKFCWFKYVRDYFEDLEATKSHFIVILKEFFNGLSC